MKDYAKTKVIDRTNWEPGPWDYEPDYYEWITEAGYEAYIGRLDFGSFYCVVIAPHPSGYDFSKFMKYLMHEMSNHISLVSKTDIENVSEFCMSFEHYKRPDPREQKFSRGGYPLLEVVKKFGENAASGIWLLNTNRNLYKDVF